jgi:hypothetical protein
MQRLHCLLNWGVWIEAMDLQEINVVCIETFEGCIDGVEDGLA